MTLTKLAITILENEKQTYNEKCRNREVDLFHVLYNLLRQSSSDNPIQLMRACKSVLFSVGRKKPML